MPCDAVVGLVLAAGYSRRFGELDKRTMPFGTGQTLLAATLARVTACFTHWRLVVREEDNLEALGLPPGTPVIRTGRASLGQAASMADSFAAIGAEATLADCSAAAVLLGDMPYIQPETLRALCAQAQRDQILRATYAGKPGHPVLFGRAFWSEIAGISGERGGAELILRHQAQYRAIPTADPGVCRDIDTLAEWHSR